MPVRTKKMIGLIDPFGNFRDHHLSTLRSQNTQKRIGHLYKFTRGMKKLLEV